MINHYLALSFLLITLIACIESSKLRNGGDSILRQEQKEPLRLRDIFDFVIQNMPDDTSYYRSSQTYQSFDFNKFEPVGLAKNSNITVYYNDENQIVKLRTANHDEYISFEFDVITNVGHNYRVLILHNNYNETNERLWIPGFILIYGGKSYFFGVKQVGQESFLKTTKQVSTVMLLNDGLIAEKTLKFNFNQLLFVTEVIYRDRNVLYSERLFKPLKKWELTDNIFLSTLENKMNINEENYSFFKERRIGIAEGFENIPLWHWGGNHEYYPDEK